MVAVLSQYRQPNQIAWGVAMGAVLGFVPKDNLVAIGAIVLLAICRVNQLAGCCMAIALTLVSGWLEPFVSLVGIKLLNQSFVIAIIARLYEIPMVPWTCLDNSLVTGGLSLGMVVMLPIYAVCRWTMRRTNLVKESNDLKQIVGDAVQYRKTVLDQASFRRERTPQPLKILYQEELTSGPEGATERETETEPSLTVPIGSHQRSEGELISSQLKAESKPMPRLFVDRETSLGMDTILRETVIEVVRYRKPQTLRSTKNTLETLQATNTETSHTGTSMAVANVSPSSSTEPNSRLELVRTKSTLNEAPMISIEAGHSAVHPTIREESLKYLLSHIASSKESSRNSGKSA